MEKIEILSAVFLTICIVLVGLASGSPDSLEKQALEVQILAINDLHGHMEPHHWDVTVSYDSNCQPVQVVAGGAEYLASTSRAEGDRH